MLVKDPKPKNALVPQSEPATLFGPCENISGSSWLFQHGKIRAKTNFQPQGLTDHDINWVKAGLDNSSLLLGQHLTSQTSQQRVLTKRRERKAERRHPVCNASWAGRGVAGGR